MLLAWFVAHATAQTPQIPQLPLALPGGAAPSADARWLTADTVSVRFLGEATPGPKFSAGDEVTVLVEDNGKSRIFADDKYGWVPSASLTKTQPAAPPTALPAGPPANPALLGGLKPLLPPKP